MTVILNEEHSISAQDLCHHIITLCEALIEESAEEGMPPPEFAGIDIENLLHQAYGVLTRINNAPTP